MTARRKEWPEYLPEVLYAYNCIPHSTTGYAPFFLFMGRQPRLPVDVILGFNQAQERKTRHDRSVTIEGLPAGTKVILRKRIMGRNKISDVWESMPYKVLARIGDTNAYMVVPLDGVGKVKTANRIDMLKFEDVQEKLTDRVDPVVESRGKHLAIMDTFDSETDLSDFGEVLLSYANQPSIVPEIQNSITHDIEIQDIHDAGTDDTHDVETEVQQAQLGQLPWPSQRHPQWNRMLALL